MTIHLTITIHAPRTKVFDAITDLSSYSRWLPQSSAFKGTTEISSSPIALGTTYTETGPLGVRNGRVTEFDPPARVAFHQPMALKPAAMGLVLDVTVEMTFVETTAAAAGGGGSVVAATVLKRDISLGYPWPLWPLKAVVANQFRSESWRTLELLKAYLESDAAGLGSH